MKRDIFSKRVNLKPYEYPELLEFKDSMRHSYWISEEFNYTADIQDFKTNVTPIEKEAITRAMLAISQIEVTVKRFWSDIYHYMPKPEVDIVGVTFGESECYDDKTEILTKNGWRPFTEINANTVVAAYDPDTKDIKFEVPQQYIEKDYSGLMNHYVDENTDILVTEKHLLYFRNLHTGDEVFCPSKDFNDTGSWGYPAKATIKEDGFEDVFTSEKEYIEYPHRKEVEYNGKVYCVTVSTGMIVTRRNGKVSINGNCRHLDAYSNLLELLGLNDMFEKLHEYKPLMARVEYMEKFMRGKNEGEKGFVLSLILFSLFVEHISLFSQFVLIMSFNKHKNLFKGMSNAIEATSKEEELHGRFGITLYNIVKEENPDIFTPEFYQELRQLASDAFIAEMNIIDWIYEKGG